MFPKPVDKIKNNFKFSAPATKVPSMEAPKKKNLDDVSEVCEDKVAVRKKKLCI